MDSGIHLIKKYKNRKLYSTKNKRYIKVTELNKLLLEKEPFKIVSRIDGSDVTKQVVLRAAADDKIGTDELIGFLRGEENV